MLTCQMIRVLKLLIVQTEAAQTSPAYDVGGNWNAQGFAPGLSIGSSAAPKHTAKALIRRGLVDEHASVRGFNAITISDVGRVALAQAKIQQGARGGRAA